MGLIAGISLFNNLRADSIQLGAGSNAPDIDNSYRTGNHLYSAWNRKGEIFNTEILFEIRELKNIQKQNVIYPSLFFSSRFLRIHAGRRFLPGPRSFYLADPAFFSGFRDLPHGRSLGSAFAQIYPEYLLPGFFLKEKSKNAGIFLTDPNDRFLLTYHPKSSTGNFALKLGRNHLPFDLYMDTQKISKTAEGYLLLARIEETDDFHFSLEGERIEKWDKSNMEENDESRKGKSGLAGITSEYFFTKHARIGLSGAGQDIGRNGYRSGEIMIKPAKNYTYGKPITGKRIYRKQSYGENNSGNKQSEAFFLGWTAGIKSGFSLIAEKRNTKTASGELQIFVRTSGIFFTAGGVFSPDIKDESEEFLFIRKSNIKGSSATFHRGCGMLFMTLRNDIIYFSLSSFQTEKEENISGNFQIRLRY